MQVNQISLWQINYDTKFKNNTDTQRNQQIHSKTILMAYKNNYRSLRWSYDRRRLCWILWL